MILYFSGTGNSQFVATALAAQTGDALQSINEQLKGKETLRLSTPQTLTFVAPIYAGRIPRVVEQYIRSAVVPQNTRTYFVATCDGSIGNADVYAERLCKEKNLCFAGMSEIKMPTGYIVMFTVPEDDKIAQLLSAAKKQVAQIGAVIAGGGRLTSPTTKWSAMSRILNPIFYSAFVKSKGFHTTTDCGGCGICAKVCPLNNISMADGKPQWGKDCTHCMACVSSCPKVAIEFGKKTQGKKRYRCSPATVTHP